MSRNQKREKRYLKTSNRYFKSIDQTGKIIFKDDKKIEFSYLTHDAIGLAGVMVPVTYVLQKSSDVSLFSFSIGYTQILLRDDQDTNNQNKFLTRNGKKYICLKESDGLRVVLRADGKIGGQWSLKIKIGLNELNEFPIEKKTDNNGRLDYDKKHF